MPLKYLSALGLLISLSANNMGRNRWTNPWLVAVIAWAAATVLATGAFAFWQVSRGQPLQWKLVREAAIMAAPFALVLAWRDRKRQ